MFELKACKESIIPEVVKVISYRQVNLFEFWPQSKYEERYHVQNVVSQFFVRHFAILQKIVWKALPWQTFTSSKSTKETLGKGLKYV